MSPYRVVVKTKTGDRKVLIAMLAHDKKIRRRHIYVVERVLPELWKLTQDEIKQFAHATTTSKNSIMHSNYQLFKEETGFKYVLFCKHGNETYLVPGSHYTQSDCLLAAMQDYLTKEGLIMIQQV